MKFRSYTGGLITGIILATTISVSASNLVQVYLQNDTKILVDGKELPLPAGMHILNYQDRIYTPARHIAESIGGKIEYDQATKRLLLTKPEPVIKEVEKEVIKEVEVRKPYYNTLPVKQKLNDVTIEVFGFDLSNYDARLSFDIINDYYKSVNLNLKSTFIEIDEQRYTPIYKAEVMNPLDPNTKKESLRLDFDGVPKNVDEFKLVMAVDFEEFVSGEGNVPRTKLFEFYFKI